MFLMEADYALKYANGDVALSIQDLGITDDDMSQMYQYTKDVATDTKDRRAEGEYHGRQLQVCSSTTQRSLRTFSAQAIQRRFRKLLRIGIHSQQQLRRWLTRATRWYLVSR